MISASTSFQVLVLVILSGTAGAAENPWERSTRVFDQPYGHQLTLGPHGGHFLWLHGDGGSEALNFTYGLRGKGWIDTSDRDSVRLRTKRGAPIELGRATDCSILEDSVQENCMLSLKPGVQITVTEIPWGLRLVDFGDPKPSHATFVYEFRDGNETREISEVVKLYDEGVLWSFRQDETDDPSVLLSMRDGRRFYLEFNKFPIATPRNHLPDTLGDYDVAIQSPGCRGSHCEPTDGAIVFLLKAGRPDFKVGSLRGCRHDAGSVPRCGLIFDPSLRIRIHDYSNIFHVIGQSIQLDDGAQKIKLKYSYFDCRWVCDSSRKQP